MKKFTKTAIGTLLGIGILAITLLFLNNFLERKIKRGLEQNLEKINATYEKVDVKLLNRRAEIVNPIFKLKGKILKLDNILLDDIQLWDYISRKDIIIGNLDISNPVVKIYNSPKEKKDSADVEKKTKFENKILIKNVNIVGGSLEIFKKDSSKHRLFTALNKIKMEQVRINAKTLKETVPFDYDLIRLNADSIFYDLDKQHKLAAGKFDIEDNHVLIKELKIIPKFSKDEHQHTTNVEKDRYDLSIDTLSMENFTWTMQNDSLKIRNSLTEISGVDFKIYRDKLQPDDLTFKPLYSKMLRDLPIKLGLDSINIKRVHLLYEENIHADRETAVVEFSNLNARISNVTNIGMDREEFPLTKIKANTNFMNVAPISVDWQFDITNKYDRFHISGEMRHLDAQQINRFLKPAMNVEASGEIVNMYFNFTGNNNQASGDMKVEYNDFKVIVLRKDGQRKNKIVSALANLIVKNKALSKKANYKEISFQRDKTKSFWNYLWNCVKNGALKAFL